LASERGPSSAAADAAVAGGGVDDDTGAQPQNATMVATNASDFGFSTLD
jgi:hypothetical protein